MPEANPGVNLYRWCRERGEQFRDYEAHEWPTYPSAADRDTALVRWVIRCLGNPEFESGDEVLGILAERRKVSDVDG